MDLLAFVLAGFIKWQTLETKIEPKEDNGVQLSVYILPTASINEPITIIPGDSNWTIEERNRLDAERQSRELYANASYTRGESYTSGQAEIIGKSYEQCVIYAKRRSGITRSIGYAGNAQVQGTTPQVGSIGIEKSKIGHAVYIEAVEGNKITITEANFLRGYITKRVLDITQFRGFIYG